jgi:tetratricopeptide (TPR) repeat protein
MTTSKPNGTNGAKRGGVANVRLKTAAVVLALVAGAAFYLAQVDAGELFGGAQAQCATSASPREVEASYAETLKLIDAGKTDEAVLHLTPRVEKGPHRGAALYLLGEIAYGEGAYGPALDYYKNALEADRALTDKSAPFNAATTMAKRVEALRSGPFAGKRTAETKVMNYLLRQLAGGCQ